MNNTRICQSLIQEMINQRNALEIEIEDKNRRGVNTGPDRNWRLGRLSMLNYLLSFHTNLLAKDAH